MEDERRNEPEADDPVLHVPENAIKDLEPEPDDLAQIRGGTPPGGLQFQWGSPSIKQANF